MNKWIKCKRTKRSNAGSSHFRQQFENARCEPFSSRSPHHFRAEIIYAGSKFRGNFKWSARKRTSGSNKMRNEEKESAKWSRATKPDECQTGLSWDLFDTSKYTPNSQQPTPKSQERAASAEAEKKFPLNLRQRAHEHEQEPKKNGDSV